MKGVVFDILNEMVEEKFGFQAWESILELANLDGIYVTTETYSDEELFKLVAAAETVSGIPANELVREFGKYMLPSFVKSHPVFFEGKHSLRDFLLTVDRVIHVEVRKLYPDAGLPKFDYGNEPEDSKKLTMIYQSPRKLCALSEGLIDGAAVYFGEGYSLEHRVCMHKGADHCELRMEFH
ncbi:MAG: putative hydrocarbon binding protein [Pseudohongiellaceae bacterium]|jgi:predicted hydrocarbon binding protein